MSSDLNNVSYVTLTLIGQGGASPQDLVEMHRSAAQIYYAVAPSRLYAEPKRLEELGYVSSVKRPGKTRERTFYTLTPAGTEALRRWAVEPPSLPRIQNEAIPKLLCGDLVQDDAALLEGLLGLRSEIAAQSAKLDSALDRRAGLAHRERYLELTENLGRRLLATFDGWLDDVEAELGASKT